MGSGTDFEPLTITPVSNARQWRDFYSLREQIYQHDSAAVMPLKKMERLQLDVNRHPFYQHARREAFLCYRSGLPVGRMVAIKDDLHNEHCQDRVGFFGFFEAIDDQAVVDQLTQAAADWLRQQDCDSMRGPVNPSMKSDFGVLTEGHAFSPTVMMGHTPQRYDRHLCEAGFSVAKTFYAFRFQLEKQQQDEFAGKWSRMEKANQRILKRYPQLEFRTVNSQNYEQTLREINDLGNQVRSRGWGFVPLTEAELDFMLKNLRRIIRFDLIRVAYWEGQLVGYIVNIPDLNWALQHATGKWDWIRMLQLMKLIKRTPKTRVIALGVDENFRKKGIALLLIQLLLDQRESFQEWEFSWIDEDNLNSIRAIERFFVLDRYKTYRLYEQEIN